MTEALPKSNDKRQSVQWMSPGKMAVAAFSNESKTRRKYFITTCSFRCNRADEDQKPLWIAFHVVVH